MIPRFLPLFRSLVLLGLGLASAVVARGQFEVRGGGFTRIYLGNSLPNGGTPPTTTPQYAGEFGNTGGSGAKDPSTTLTVRYPSQIYRVAQTTTPSGVAIVVHRSTIGSTFAPGVPRYNLGDVITRPAMQIGDLIPADDSYWRDQPVGIGEVISQPSPLPAETYLPLQIAAVNVKTEGNNYSSPPTVTFSGGGGSGATAVARLAQGKVIGITLTSPGTGYTALPAVVLSGGGGSGAEAEAVVSTLPYYYSPHAGKVFASQAGRVVIVWVTRVPVATATDPTLKYRFREESFSVSTATRNSPRTIYWNVGSFRGPPVDVPGGRIETVNPIFSGNFPSKVVDEYVPVGYVPPADPLTAPSSELRTLWFDKTTGFGTLKAYNLEGRILIEYLGALKSGASGIHEFLGADVVDVVRVPDPIDVTVYLGDQITPRDEAGRLLPVDGSSEWVPSPAVSVEVEGQTFYGNITRKDGRKVYYAERENLTPDRVAFYWLEKNDAAIHFLASPATPGLGLYWPKIKNHYQQIWPSDLGAYVHNTVGPNGSSAAAGLQFAGGQLPQLVYQDDPAQAETSVDTATQRVVVSLANSTDGMNRSLLKFASANEVWYFRLFTQTEVRPRTIVVTNGGSGYTSSPTVSFTDGGDGAVAVANIAGGKVASVSFTSPGRNFTASTRVVVTGGGGTGATVVMGDLGYQEGDAVPAVSAAAVVGDRINPPAGYEIGGYIASGTNYLPEAYPDPFAVGVPDASRGAIIPVNAAPGNSTLKVWWFKKIPSPSATFQPFYSPAKIGTYSVSYPSATVTTADAYAGTGYTSAPTVVFSGGGGVAAAATAFIDPNTGKVTGFKVDARGASFTSAPAVTLSGGGGTGAVAVATVLNGVVVAVDVKPNSTIVLASNSGSGDLSAAEIAGSIYVQNDPTLPGYNPNEEHALALAGRVYALRDDLNVTAGTGYTSDPFVLLKYTSPFDGRPAVHAFKVVREITGTTNDVLFNYAVTAGTRIQGPMPLPVLPLPIDPVTETVRNLEVPGTADSAVHSTAPKTYTKFTFVDRKGDTWVYRGPHANAAPSLGMQFYYTMREGFYFPSEKVQPEVGTILPYLRPIMNGAPSGHAVTGTPLTIIYRPVWPTDDVEMSVAETLALPKFGLPAIHAQSSVELLYQQSVAIGGESKTSVTLHDPVREKTFAFGAVNQLAALPSSVLVAVSQGKTYFQGLPPHLQSRLYFDASRGTKGALVFVGHLVDEVAGHDYVELNVLTADDVASVKSLASATDANKAKWDQAIDNLTTRVETFVEDELRPGTYKSDGRGLLRGPTQLAVVPSSDTAVVDYALTATGQGSGWVSMIFGNGRAFTAEGEPVTVQVLKVTPHLYTGELKVQASSNPLDEQVSLRHSGDFAAKPEDYEFEWRYAPPQDGVAPPVYTYAMSPVAASTWKFVANPVGALPTTAEYASSSLRSLPFSLPIRTNASRDVTRPAQVLSSTSALDFTAGIPERVVFTVELSDANAGFVLYVDHVAALAFQAPVPFSNVLAAPDLVSGGLTRQFEVDTNYFQNGPNKIEVALFTSSNAGVSGSVNFRFYTAVATDRVIAAGSPWQTPNGTLTNQVVVGGSPTAPLGSPLLVLTDNYFTMRYRPKASANSVAGTAYSQWMPPKLVEGWIKRVLAGINPFNQRIADLYNNAVNTDVSLITQAGKRWEGNIALNLANIDSFGLIEIYETVLNRGKNISIDSGYNYAPANDALLLAAGYLSDLYTLLGNEAYADAANPTISVDDSGSATEVNTSRFAFEGQVKSVLEEELALLRGRDDFLAPGVTVSPAYNRLYWNYTRGINSGEALYAVNYNIREKIGSSTADGKLDAADAQRMFPQGHGDAYGHYLTALTGYTRLLQNPKFSWTPRSEAVTVLGQAVQIDYFDERKFAGAAANVARTAQQVLTLTHRQSYKDDPASGWTHYRDGTTNSATGVTRYWGVDEWTSRATQGAYLNWILGNTLLPEKDINPQHTGVQVIDRTTVPELKELPALGADFQTRIDNVNARLNPLGLSPSAIAFDISPAELKSGKSHFDQIYERSLRAVLNAKGAFDQAARMTRLLRNQENQIDGSSAAIDDQEGAFEDAMIELYGRPYPGDIGAGKTYAQDYSGPDTLHWFIVDRATDVIDTTKPVSITVNVPVNVKSFPGFTAASVLASYNSTTETTKKTLTVQPDQIVQFADIWSLTGGALGTRRVTGTLQQSLSDFQSEFVAFRSATNAVLAQQQTFSRSYALYQEMLKAHTDTLAKQATSDAEILRLAKVKQSLIEKGSGLMIAADAIRNTAANVASFLPKVIGLANDPSSTVTGGILTTAGVIADLLSIGGGITLTQADRQDLNILEQEQLLAKNLDAIGFSFEEKQFAVEYEMQYRELVAAHFELAQLAGAVQRAAEGTRNLIAAGDKLQADRETFRQRAAAIIQGYRTKDLTFRTFRNESLEQYRSLYDLAARYTYLAAKAYDYETGLLGSTAGQSTINAIVASRSLGDLTGGTPQAQTS